jgi:hypothetical protein
MLALAAVNGVGVVLFGVLYATAGARLMPQIAFVVCLAVLFVLVTTLWVRVEGRHRALEPVRRIGRVAAGLVIVVLVTPVVILMPLFWLDTYLPPEAGLTPYLAPMMTLVLISLVLVVIVNLVGAVVALGSGALHRIRHPA